MRALAAIIAVFIAGITPAQYTDTDMSSEIMSIYSVDFTDINTGLLTGVQSGNNNTIGKIFRTTNGGNSWAEVFSFDILGSCRTAQFITPTLVYGAGDYNYYGKILKSTDAGLTWDTVPNISDQLPNSISAMYFIDANVGFVTGGSSDGGIYKTTDAGLNWTENFNYTGPSVWDIDFTDNNTGVVSCFNGEVWLTTDAGDTWTNIYTTTSANLNDISIVNNTIYVCSLSGEVLKSTDLGVNWTTLPLSASAAHAIEFTSETNGIVSGTGMMDARIFSTTDGGATFTQDHSTSTVGVFGGYFDVHIIDGTSTAYVAGVNGYSSTNSYVSITENETQIAIQAFPNPVENQMNLRIDALENVEIQLLSLEGKVLFTQLVSSPQFTLNMEEYTSGMYLLRVKGNGKVGVQKIEKK